MGVLYFCILFFWLSHSSLFFIFLYVIIIHCTSFWLVDFSLFFIFLPLFWTFLSFVNHIQTLVSQDVFCCPFQQILSIKDKLNHNSWLTFDSDGLVVIFEEFSCLLPQNIISFNPYCCRSVNYRFCCK